MFYVRPSLCLFIHPVKKVYVVADIDLLHDVSLRNKSNKMDSLNLSIVICPNLLKGSNQARDVAMVGVPGTPAFFVNSNTNSNNKNDGNAQGELERGNKRQGTATLGMVVALCIRRYYEVFDEEQVVVDVDVDPEEPMYVLSNEGEEEEEEEDKLQKRVTVTPPHVWVGPCSGGSSSNPPQLPKRHKNTLSSGSNSELGSTTRSVQSAIVVGETNQYPTYNKSKSTISIENGGGASGSTGTTIQTKGGSISVGRGTSRKGSGASVEAVGVTAGGFFSSPDGGEEDGDVPQLVPDGKGGWKKL